MDDYMELGESGLITFNDGWFKDKKTGYMIDPEGNMYDESGEKINEIEK